LLRENFGDAVPSKISLGLAATWQSLQNCNYYSYYYYYYWDKNWGLCKFNENINYSTTIYTSCWASLHAERAGILPTRHVRPVILLET